MASGKPLFNLADADRRTLQRARYWSVRRAFGSDANLARAMGVHRSRVSRWKRGEPLSEPHHERLVALDAVVELLTDFLEPTSIPKWLFGVNAHLGHTRPIDAIRQGDFPEVIRAIQAEKSGAFA